MDAKTKIEYLHNPDICPFCKSNDLEATSMDVDSNRAWQPVKCNGCGEEWTDIYKLVDIE